MAKVLKFIETPRGWVKHTANGSAELVWKSDFAPKVNNSFNKAQVFVDSEVLRTSNKFVPKVTSMLIKSGILGTEAGTGEVAWIAPYAWMQYHLENRKTTQNVNPLGGPYWFERAWKIYGQSIILGAKSRIGEGFK